MKTGKADWHCPRASEQNWIFGPAYPDPQLPADGAFRKVVDIAIVDQSDTKAISDKAQKDARTDVMFDDSGKRHVASNSVAEQECFAPAHQ